MESTDSKLHFPDLNSIFIAYRDETSGSANLAYIKLDSTINTSNAALVYSKQTSLVISGKSSTTINGDELYYSFQTLLGNVELLRINFTDGSVMNLYHMNQNLANMHFQVINSKLYGYYTTCCTKFWRFYYDNINFPTST